MVVSDDRFYRLGWSDGYRWAEPADSDSAIFFRSLRRSPCDLSSSVFAWKWMADQRTRRPSDFPMSSFTLLCMSVRASSVVAHILRESCQQLPVSGPERGYETFNVVRIVDCLDLQRSSVTRLPRGKIIAIPRPVLIKRAVNGAALFAVPEHEYHLFVSEDFRQSIDRSGVRGFDFQPCEVSNA